MSHPRKITIHNAKSLKKAKNFASFVCRMERSLDSKREYENSTVEKCGKKSKFTTRTERKYIQIAKANRREHT